MPAVCAQEAPKNLPTLLIKGEVVSVDTNDPTAALLKVKDRYGFETPIYLMPETKIAQGDQTLTVANLTAGTMVEVEYNFDINTAKRHAVSVNVPQPKPTASQTASAEATATPGTTVAPAASPPSPAAMPTGEAGAPQPEASSTAPPQPTETTP